VIGDRMLRRILGDKEKGKRDDAESYSIRRFIICSFRLFFSFFKNNYLNQALVSIESSTNILLSFFSFPLPDIWLLFLRI